MSFFKYSKISEEKIKKIIQCFSLDIESSKTTKLMGVTRDTTDRIYRAIREKIYAYSSKCFPKKEDDKEEIEEIEEIVIGEYEVDESYFGPRRVRGKRGRGASCKTLVFGVLNCFYKKLTYYLSMSLKN